MMDTKPDTAKARWTTIRWGENRQDMLDAGDTLCTTLANLQSQNTTMLEVLETLQRSNKKGFINLKNFSTLVDIAISKAKEKR